MADAQTAGAPASTSKPAAGDAPLWPLFVQAAMVLAGTAGFGLGAALFAASALGLPLGLWWPAAAQAHGHVQVFGFGGLMVLGVGLHFLPRLRGSSLLHPARTRAGALLLIVGLALRALSQPALAATDGSGTHVSILEACLVVSGVLELLGASLILLQMGSVLRRGPPLRSRTHLWPVLPFFVTAFATYWLALGINLAGLLAAARSGTALVADDFDDLSTQVGFYGFLIPISVAMAERNFPILFRTPLPNLPLLRAGLAVLLAGLGLRAAGALASSTQATGLGALATAAAIGMFFLGLGIVAPRRPLPRQPVRPLREPIQLHAVTAFLWLLFVAFLLLQTALAAWDSSVVAVSQDAERHALGAGFVTVLILGLGAQLLPGFANRRRRSDALLWVTLVLGNGAALLRVAPALISSLSSTLGGALSASSGVAALVALLVFAANVPLSPRP